MHGSASRKCWAKGPRRQVYLDCDC
jgi:hypothetical protein